MLPTTFKGNQKQPLIYFDCWSKRVEDFGKKTPNQHVEFSVFRYLKGKNIFERVVPIL